MALGLKKRGWRAIEVEGMGELIDNLKKLKDKDERRALAAGISAGMTVVGKQLRKEVSAQPVDTPHAASMKTGMRKLVGRKFNRGGLRKGKYHKTVAKVGFGVGKKTEGRMSKGTTAGAPKNIGVGKANVHWFVLGTPRRQRSQMPAFFAGCIDRAVSVSSEAALNKAVTKAKERMEKEAAKRAAKKRSRR